MSEYSFFAAISFDGISLLTLKVKMCNKDRRRKYGSTPRTRLEVALRRPKIPPTLNDIPTLTFLEELTIVAKTTATTRELLGELLSQGDCGSVYRKLGDDTRVIKTIVSKGKFNQDNPLIPGNKRNCYFYDNLRIAVKMGKVGIGPVIHEVWLPPSVDTTSTSTNSGGDAEEQQNIFIEMDFVCGQTLYNYLTRPSSSNRELLPASKKGEYKITEEQKARFTPKLYAMASETMRRMAAHKVEHGDCHSHNIIIEKLTCLPKSLSATVEGDWKVTMIDFDFAQESDPGVNDDQREFDKLHKSWIGSDAKLRYREWRDQVKTK